MQGLFSSSPLVKYHVYLTNLSGCLREYMQLRIHGKDEFIVQCSQRIRTKKSYSLPSHGNCSNILYNFGGDHNSGMLSSLLFSLLWYFLSKSFTCFGVRLVSPLKQSLKFAVVIVFKISVPVSWYLLCCFSSWLSFVGIVRACGQSSSNINFSDIFA